jgi:membrane-bound lytic murein transglycosylase B
MLVIGGFGAHITPPMALKTRGKDCRRSKFGHEALRQDLQIIQDYPSLSNYQDYHTGH